MALGGIRFGREKASEAGPNHDAWAMIELDGTTFDSMYWSVGPSGGFPTRAGGIVQMIPNR